MHQNLTMTMFTCEITDMIWVEGNSITGGLENFFQASRPYRMDKMFLSKAVP